MSALPRLESVVVYDTLGPIRAKVEVDTTGRLVVIDTDDDLRFTINTGNARALALAMTVVADWIDAQPVLINEQSR